MCHEATERPEFFALLLAIDEDCARRTRLRACSCGGALHQANYPRKPRGCPIEARDQFASRFSFCCADCRRRTTAPSVRFLGRRVYLGLVVVLVAARHAGQQPAPRELAQLCAALVVPMRTVKRWCAWWCEAFVHTRVWQELGPRFVPPIAAGTIPAAILERMAGTPVSRFIALLQILMPLSVRVIALAEGH